MATISTSGIEAGRIIRSAHVLRIIEALDGEANNDIIISGSLITTGSVGITGSLNIVGNVTGSEFTGSFTGDGSNLTGVTAEWDGTHDGNADITGSFNVSGSTGLTGSLDVSGSVVLSGSFSGSFEGDGSALTGLPATNSGSFSGSFEGDGSALTGLPAADSGSFSGSFEGDGSALTGITGEWDGTRDGNAEITGSFNVSGSTGLTGSLEVEGNLSTTGSNVTFGERQGSAPSQVIQHGGYNRVTTTINNSSGLGDNFAQLINVARIGGAFGADASNKFQIEIEDADQRVDPHCIASIYTSGSYVNPFNGDKQFLAADKDMSFVSGSKIEMYRDTSITGSLGVSQSVTANSFIGDGSALTGVTAEWNGIRDGNAEITGSFNVSGSIGITGSLVEQIHPQQKNRVQTTIATTSTSVDYIKLNNVARLNGSNDPMSKFQIGIKELSTTPSTAAYSMVNFYSSASNDFGAGVGTIFKQEDRDMSLISGSKIELYRDTEITGSLIVSSSAIIDDIKIYNSGSSSNVLIGNNIGGVLLNNHNTIIGGDNCGFNVRGSHNTIIGTDAGLNLLVGNVAIGDGALTNSINGAYNIGIGRDAGRNSNADGIDNMYIGYRVGPTTASVEDAQLYIGNSNYHTDDDTLIRGDFDNQTLEFNADTTISGSLGITEVLSLAPIDPLPTNKPTGSFATSGSAGSVKPYFWDGTNWNALY